MKTGQVIAAALVAAAIPAAAAAVRWAGLPFGYYTSDTGPAAGIYGAAYFRPAGAAPATRDSYVQPMAVYTWKRQFRLDLNGDLYSPSADWRLQTRNRYEKYPTTFWPPPGAADAAKAYYADYTRRMLTADLNAYRRLSGRLYAGLGAYAADYGIVEWAPDAEGSGGGVRPGEQYAPGVAGGFILGPTAFAEVDTRDRRNTTSSGWFARARFSAFARGAGSDYEFRWYELDARRFCPLARFGRRWTFANRFLLSGRDGAPPYWAMPTLGGSALLRGEPEGRARGRWVVAYQEEVRIPLVWRLVAAAFTDVGDVGFTMADFSFERVKLTAGAGLRLDLLAGGESRVRFDYGRGKDSQGFYVVFDEAF